MRIVTLLVLIALIAGGIWYANQAGWFEKAEETGDTFEAHYARGLKEYNDTQYDAAIESFKTALARTDEAGDRPMCLRRLGDCYKEKGMYAEAIETYEKVIAEYPDHKIVPNTKNAIEMVRGLGHF